MGHAVVPLRRNRDFNLLLAGQAVSDLGWRISGIAVPLLVLGMTGSPAQVGVAEFAGTLPLLLLTLPAGALADRLDRKRLMIVADSVRCAAVTSIVVALALHVLTYAQVVAVAAVGGAGFVVFGVGERSALRNVVADAQLPAALARNQGRAYVALLAGQPLGGVLYGLGRLVPFLFDAVSYFVSVCTLTQIRADFQEARSAAARAPHADEIRSGLAWFWRQPFVRTTSLLVLGSDFTVNALYLLVIVVARQRGATPALVGAMFAFLGVGGLLGALAAPWLARRLRTRLVVVGTMGTVAVLTPLVVFVPGPLAPGVVYGAMFVLHPTWNATVGAHRLRLTPDELQGRVQSVATLLSLGPVAFAFLGVGFAPEAVGSTGTIAALFALMLVAAVAAASSRAVRDAPGHLGGAA